MNDEKDHKFAVNGYDKFQLGPRVLSRILKEYKVIKSQKNPYWCAYPLQEEFPYEWHFTIRGPVETDFNGGCYHGKILLSEEYPSSVPNLIMMTKNGRFEVDEKICLTVNGYQPELWKPQWGISTLLDALYIFFSIPADGTLNGLDSSPDVRKNLAKVSTKWICPICDDSNEEIILKNCSEPLGMKPNLPEELELQTRIEKTSYNLHKEKEFVDVKDWRENDKDVLSSYISSVNSSSAGFSCTTSQRINKRRISPQYPFKIERKSKKENLILCIDISIAIVTITTFLQLISLVLESPFFSQ